MSSTRIRTSRRSIPTFASPGPTAIVATSRNAKRCSFGLGRRRESPGLWQLRSVRPHAANRATANLLPSDFKFCYRIEASPDKISSTARRPPLSLHHAVASAAPSRSLHWSPCHHSSYLRSRAQAGAVLRIAKTDGAAANGVFSAKVSVVRQRRLGDRDILNDVLCRCRCTWRESTLKCHDERRPAPFAKRTQ